MHCDIFFSFSVGFAMVNVCNQNNIVITNILFLTNLVLGLLLMLILII